uniref:Uncharacterized protein n=1 Tax=Brassica oleracea TaxID=3712 RepID=A0A3P6CZ45_BRAOL|nr:unnamed protein product [Brassica oleracea]
MEIAPPTFVSGPTTLEIQKEQDRDHDQGENQKLSLYQALSLKTLLADYLLLIAYKDRISGSVRMHIVLVALIVSAFELSSLKCRYCASVSTYIVWG